MNLSTLFLVDSKDVLNFSIPNGTPPNEWGDSTPIETWNLRLKPGFY